ncbi:hypothetical protein GCM10010377_10870 [Streptomyces viridiviolaceus]|nr:hypothetical protein GCM10010377_10870 [Streptomyces viridiviolaceus]
MISDAVRHTKGPAALRVRRSPPGTLRIGAWDADPEPPEPPARFARTQEAEEGRGTRTGAGGRRRVGAASAGQARQPGQVRVVRAGGGLKIPGTLSRWPSARPRAPRRTRPGR